MESDWGVLERMCPRRKLRACVERGLDGCGCFVHSTAGMRPRTSLGFKPNLNLVVKSRLVRPTLKRVSGHHFRVQGVTPMRGPKIASMRGGVVEKVGWGLSSE